MKRIIFAGLAAVLGTGLMAAQAPAAGAPTPGPAGEVMGSYNRLKPFILKAADVMPSDMYGYKPTPEIRSFARVVNHITEAQSQTCSALLGTKFDAAVMVPSDTADKATVMAGLKASFDLCDKAYATVSDANVGEMMKAGQRSRSRIGLAWGNVSHDNEQYAQLATYLRLKGLVPPSAEK